MVLSAKAENNAFTAPMRDNNVSPKKLPLIEPDTSIKTTIASAGESFYSAFISASCILLLNFALSAFKLSSTGFYFYIL